MERKSYYGFENLDETELMEIDGSSPGSVGYSIGYAIGALYGGFCSWAKNHFNLP